MGSLAFLWPMAACVITGLALYVTRGVLDQTVTANGVLRFAMLPPWQALFGFFCLGGLVLVGIDHLNAPRGTTTVNRPRLGELVLPLFALVILFVPFLPVIPDWWPAVQALSGPLGAIVWLVVAALQVWTLWQSRLITARSIERWSLNSIAVALFVAMLAIAGLAAQKLTGTTLFPSGDEPHYLVIAQSLWRDGDLKIENNHERRDYREYYTSDLEPHYLTRGTNGQIYSIHPIGISVMLAPIYALAGYKGSVWFLIALGALALAIAWRWTVNTLNAPGAATFAWAAIALSAPFTFNSFTIYPEIAASLAVIFAYYTTLTTNTERSGPMPWIAAGLAIAALPWLSTKYAPMSAALLLVVIYRLRKKEPAPFLRNTKVWMVVAIYAISVLAWFAFFYAIWGSPLPMAPYGSQRETGLAYLRVGAAGLLFDQEYGLLAYAPVYVLAGTGLFEMWRNGGELRRQALEIVFIFSGLLIIVGAFHIWWGGAAAPARPIASGLPLLMLPIAVAFRSAPAGSPRRAAHHLLLWVGFGIAVTLATEQNGLLIGNARDGSSALLDFWSPRWDLWSLAPSFVRQEWPNAWLLTTWWLAVAGAAAFLMSRTRSSRAGASALFASITFAFALLVIAITAPWLPSGRTEAHTIDLSARARLAALDGFDARARPASIVYDPLRKAAAVEALPELVLSVKPLQRSDRQPVRVIHNGRFSLPAGTYEVAVQFNNQPPVAPAPLSLQIGRNGPPLQTWTLQPQAGQRWHTTLWLPVDANFVGLRGPAEIESAISAITITPTAIVDAGSRPLVPVVLAAGNYAGATFYFHDEQLYPEAKGFWTMGGQASRITVATHPGHAAPVTLRMHPGATANTVRLSTFGWQQSYDLVPGQSVEVELPQLATGVVPLTITAETGFYPRDIDPASTDRRFLGVWVEVKTPASEPPAEGKS
ncbi:MAG TPA: hypothetical protein VM096_12625 [Vicinamibacterales bacterium]|nr:hypothetical protein [Vicinamibacterales bacterium]